MLDLSSLGELAGGGVVGVIAALLVAARSKQNWVEEGVRQAQSADVTLKKPVPTIRTKEQTEYVPRRDFDQHVGRHEAHVRKTSDDVSKLHGRIDVESRTIGRMEGKVDSVQSDLKTLLEMAIKRNQS